METVTMHTMRIIRNQHSQLYLMLDNAWARHDLYRDNGNRQAANEAKAEATQIEWLLDNMTIENPWLSERDDISF